MALLQLLPLQLRAPILAQDSLVQALPQAHTQALSRPPQVALIPLLQVSLTP